MMKTKIFLFTLIIYQITSAQNIYKSSIDNGGASVGNGGIQMVYTIGEVNVREVNVGNISLSEGFIGMRFIYEYCLPLSFNLGWNIFSSPNYPNPADILQIYQPTINNGSIVKIQDEYGNSLEDWGIFGGWVNNIGDMSPTEGYKIKVKFNDVMEICGAPLAYPFEILLKTGWNIMGYPQTQSYDAMDVVQQLIDRGTLIKIQDEKGNSIEDWGVFGGWVNNIGDFTPGEGYKIKVNENEILWIYDSYPKSSTILPKLVVTTHFHTDFEGNGVDHMNINLVGLPINLLREGDELAVFDGTNCAGAVTILQHHLIRQTISIAASATDNQGMAGFTEGNPITLKLWNSKNNQEYNLEPEIVKGTQTFSKHETTLASLDKYATTGLEGLAGAGFPEIRCYPNPFSNTMTIEINLAEDSHVQVEVQNQSGQQVKYILTKQILLKGLNKLTWDGRNTGNQSVSKGIYFLRIEIDEAINNKKIVLSK